MASYVFNSFLSDVFKGEHVLVGVANTYVIALVTEAAFAQSADVMKLETRGWNELSATWDIRNDSNYDSDGYILKELDICRLDNWYGGDIVYAPNNGLLQWASQSLIISARGFVIYKMSNNKMVYVKDFLEVKHSDVIGTTGLFSINVNSFFNIKVI